MMGSKGKPRRDEMQKEGCQEGKYCGKVPGQPRGLRAREYHGNHSSKKKKKTKGEREQIEGG